MKKICLASLLIFYFGHAVAACPDGYMEFDRSAQLFISPECADNTVYVSDVPVTCDATETNCFPEYVCDLGVSTLKTSTGVAVQMYSQKITTPSINISVGDSVCYVPLIQGQKTESINLVYNSEYYYAASLKVCRVDFDVATSPVKTSVSANEVNWSVTVNGTQLKGISYCGNTAPDSDDDTTDIVINSSSSLTTNYYCYCRTVVPFLSRWFYAALYKTNGSTACDSYCASACVNEFASDSAMRTAIYNSMK